MYKNLEKGRSMIEMLGVLAIIGVLSVGGIAGYSKAIEMYKTSKAATEYSYIIQGLLEHKDNIIKNNPNTQNFLNEFMMSAHIVPDNWISFKQGNIDLGFHDPYGNDVYFYTSYKEMAMDIYLGGESRDSDNRRLSQGFSEKLCLTLYQNFVQPLHNAVYYTGVGEWSSGAFKTFYGDAYCSAEKQCLQSAAIADMQKACKQCTYGYCDLFLRFK